MASQSTARSGPAGAELHRLAAEIAAGEAFAGCDNPFVCANCRYRERHHALTARHQAGGDEDGGGPCHHPWEVVEHRRVTRDGGGEARGRSRQHQCRRRRPCDAPPRSA